MKFQDLKNNLRLVLSSSTVAVDSIDTDLVRYSFHLKLIYNLYKNNLEEIEILDAGGGRGILSLSL